MKFHLLLGFLCLMTLLLLSAQAEEEQKEASIGEENLPMPMMFRFAYYKNIFGKHYKTLVEEMARSKIFLARAFRSFISLVNFKHFRQNYYLKLNQMSDWTEVEIRSLFMKRSLKETMGEVSIMESQRKELAETPVASLEDIKTTLEEVLDKPEYSDIASELRVARVKRQAEIEQEVPSRASLTVNDLLVKPDSEEEEEETFDELPSSNPNYVAPELTSFGTENSDEQPSIHQEQDYNFILSLPGVSYVSSMLNSAGYNIFGAVRDRSKESKLVELADLKITSKYSAKRKGNELTIDHRSSNCFPRVKNQGKCGSCYIFSTTSLYEWRFCQENDRKVVFSEQYVLDCGERSNLRGCDGGEEKDVAVFYGTHGVELLKHYPFRGFSDICPYEPLLSPQKMGYHRLNSPDGSMVGVKYENLEEFLEEQPLLVGLGVDKDFVHYGGGIKDGHDCDPELQHSMVMVGMGKENGVEYYLFRNSFATSWGEKGHYRLNKRAPMKCFLDDGLTYYLHPRRGKYVFKRVPNEEYFSKPVEQRRYDATHKKPIERNPFTYFDPSEEEAVVNSSEDSEPDDSEPDDSEADDS